MGLLKSLRNQLLPETTQRTGEERDTTTDRYDVAYYTIQVLSFIFFTYNSVTTAYPFRDNIPTLFLLIATYLDFILLFWIGREFQNTPLKVHKMNRLKRAAWVVVSTLNLLLPYQLAIVLPNPFQLVVCVFAFTFYFVIILLCFVLPDDASTAVTAVPSVAPLPHDRYDVAYYTIQVLSFIFFTYNSVTTAYPFRDNFPTLFLLIATYLDFILLFWIGREFQNTTLKVDKRNRLKVAAWVVVSTLNLLLPYQLAIVLPNPFQLVVCVFAFTFYFVIILLCFVLPDDASTAVKAVPSVAPLPHEMV